MDKCLFVGGDGRVVRLHQQLRWGGSKATPRELWFLAKSMGFFPSLLIKCRDSGYSCTKYRTTSSGAPYAHAKCKGSYPSLLVTCRDSGHSCTKYWTSSRGAPCSQAKCKGMHPSLPGNRRDSGYSCTKYRTTSRTALPLHAQYKGRSPIVGHLHRLGVLLHQKLDDVERYPFATCPV
jgi:hypothetical protein